MDKKDSHTRYFNKEGIEVPSATTVLKLLNKPALVYWANYLGFKNLDVDEVVNESARLGTLIHWLINAYLEKSLIIYVPTGKFPAKLVSSYFSSFKVWYNTNNVEPILLEKSFSSDLVGGTLDFYGRINDKLTLLDFKTSKKIRLSMFFQLAIYCILLEENGYEVEQVGILLVNNKYRDEKYLTREELTPYVEFVKELIILFHSYKSINNKDKWEESI